MQMGVGAAILGGVGLVGSVITGGKQADASRDAAATGAASAARAEEGINRRFDVSREDLRPAREAGDRARAEQEALLGLSGTSAQEAATQNLVESPAQQFIRKRAQKNLLQNAAAIGGIGGGDVRSALVEQGTGFALQDINNQFNRLGTLSGAGNAATQTGVVAGGQAAAQAGNAAIAGGNALAQGRIGQQQARTDAFGNALQFGGQIAGALNTPSQQANSQFLQPVQSNTSLTLF